MIKLAILSPSHNTYSETFIQAHKKLPFHVFYYYGGGKPNHLEGKGYLLSNRVRRLYASITNKINKKPINDYALTYSLKKEKINAVLAEYGTVAAENLDIIKKLNLPLFVFFHGYDASVHHVLEQYKLKYAEVFAYATCIFSVSNAMTNKLIGIGCPAEKIIYNVYGPNDLFLNLNANFNNKNFVSIGRFVDKKAPYYTILAFSRALKKHPDAKLIMAGDGPLWNTCKNLISYLKIEENISLVGVVKPEEWAKLLENTIGFIQHSIKAENGDMEGTPVAVLEACAAGVPVISTKHAGIPDIIKHQINGLLCNEHDVEGMADNIISLIENTNLVKELGYNAKNTIKENYTMQKHLDTISKEIIKILN